MSECIKKGKEKIKKEKKGINNKQAKSEASTFTEQISLEQLNPKPFYLRDSD